MNVLPQRRWMQPLAALASAMQHSATLMQRTQGISCHHTRLPGQMATAAVGPPAEA